MNVNRQLTWAALSAAVAALALLSCAPRAADGPAGDAEPQPPRPNILFLFADDQRADTIRAWGNELIDTPNLDRLAAEGWSFRRNYVFGSNSGAVCVPSRAMVLTGRSWMRSPNRMEGVPTLPRLLESAGYRTFITGKWHNGEEALLRAFDRGTAIYLGGMADHTQTEVQDIENGGMVRRRVGESFSSELFADTVIEFLDEQAAATASGESEQPFFAYVPFTAPHDPRQPPPEYRERYYERNLPLPPNYMPQHPFDNGALILRDENLAAWPRAEEVIRDQLAEYYGLITHLDEQVGRILDALDENGQAENTIVVYAADHGLSVGSHGLLGKQNLYEHSMRCPLIIRGPGIPHGTTDAFTYLYDLFPTLLAQGVCGGAARDRRPGPCAPLVRRRPDLAAERLPALPRPHARRARRPLQADRVSQRQPPPALRSHRRPPRAPQPGGRPRPRRNSSPPRSEGWQTAMGDTVPLSVADPAPLQRDLTGTDREPDRATRLDREVLRGVSRSRRRVDMNGTGYKSSTLTKGWPVSAARRAFFARTSAKSSPRERTSWVAAIHTDDASATPECRESIGGEAAVAQ